MQHRCTVCGQLYKEGSDEILSGCTCGNKLFYFVNDKKFRKDKSSDNYFYELEDEENQELIVFDLEAVNIKDHGKYEIDINALLNNDSGLVYKFGEGKYSIDIEQNFSRIRQKK